MTTKPPVGKPFEKGRSGNPGGRPKAVVEVQELAREKTAAAFATLISIAEDEAAPAAARVAAANSILDRGWGKPAQPLTGEGGDTPIAMSFSWLPVQEV